MKKLLFLVLAFACSFASAGEVLGIRPSSDATQTIGTALNRYRAVYTQSISDGANIVTPAEIRELIDNPGTIDHRDLTNRSAADQHPIGAVTGLQTALDGKAATTVTDALSSRIDDIDDTAVFYDADGNISYPAGLSLRVAMPDGTKKDVLATDTNGNALLGEADIQVNITASQRPTMTIAGGAADGIAGLSDLADFVTETDLDAEMAYKADLVGGVVPDAQLPAHVKVTNWGPVAAETDLVTLTAATVNDRAFVGAAPGPYTTYYLLAMPPTTQTNWIQAGGGGGGTSGVESVNGDTGPAVTVDLAQFPDVQAALDDKADAADLALLAPLASPALTGTPTAPTAPANAVGSQIINADALRTAMSGNLGATNPLMDGTATAGLATTVARSDHVHPTDTTRAPLNSPTFVGTPKAPTAPAGTATTQLASTEFVADAIDSITVGAAFAIVPDYAAQDSTNQMPADGASFTVPADGFVVVSRDGDAAARQSVMVDGVEAAGATGSVSVTLPVSAGDVVTASGAGWTAGSCYYVPPKYVPVNRQYSTDEQLTGETWIDGRPVWRRVFTGIIPASGTINLGVINDLDIAFSITGMWRYGGQEWNMIPYVSSNAAAKITAYVDSAGVKFSNTAGSAYSGQPIYIIVHYVKS